MGDSRSVSAREPLEHRAPVGELGERVEQRQRLGVLAQAHEQLLALDDQQAQHHVGGADHDQLADVALAPPRRCRRAAARAPRPRSRARTEAPRGARRSTPRRPAGRRGRSAPGSRRRRWRPPRRSRRRSSRSRARARTRGRAARAGPVSRRRDPRLCDRPPAPRPSCGGRSPHRGRAESTRAVSPAVRKSTPASLPARSRSSSTLWVRCRQPGLPPPVRKCWRILSAVQKGVSSRARTWPPRSSCPASRPA